jgi:hypothetical protein
MENQFLPKSSACVAACDFRTSISDRTSILFSFDFHWFIHLGSHLFYAKKERVIFKVFID